MRIGRDVDMDAAHSQDASQKAERICAIRVHALLERKRRGRAAHAADCWRGLETSGDGTVRGCDAAVGIKSARRAETATGGAEGGDANDGPVPIVSAEPVDGGDEA